MLLLASFLVLGACGQKEESKSDNQKSEKTQKKDKKEDKKKSDSKKGSQKENDENNQSQEAAVQNDNQQQADQQNMNAQNNEQQNTQQATVPQNNQQQNTNVQNNQQAAQPQQSQALTKEEMTQKLKSGQNVNGMVDAEGNTWHQGPGGGDAVGITKPDGTTCTVGGCMTPDGRSVPDEEW